MEAQDLTCDVLIVGLGPVGAVLATLLGQTGRSVIAIEPQRDVYPLPRAAHIDHEIMRIFQGLGIIEQIQPHVRVAPNYEFRAADGRALVRLERENLLGVSGWPVGYNFYQPGVEHAVRQRVAQMANVRLLYGAKFVGLAGETGDAVDVLIDSEDTPHRRVRAAFVVGCDGAWSPVREACGIGLDDYRFDEPWLVLDAAVSDESVFPQMNLQLCDPARPTTFVHMGPGRLRWEFMLKPDEISDEMLQPENVDALLAPWRELGPIHVERTAVYRFHGLVAKAWRHGRIFLAGDSAHQMPPFMGQGLCSGLRDAANLAWKIDAVLGSGNFELLDTYQAEREPHVRVVIERAIEMGRIVCTLDPERAAARDAEMLASPQIGAPALFPPIHGATLAETPAAGTIFPQPWVLGEKRLDDVLGGGAWLLHCGADPGPIDHVTRVDVSRDLPRETAKIVASWLGEHGVEAVLVRPDRYVFGAGTVESLALAWKRQVEHQRLAA